MAKIPFNIKYRPQIESGEYKVETRDGKRVRVLCYDANNIVPIVALVTFDDGSEGSRDYYFDGTMTCDRENPLDLFIVTPEPELTYFETALMECVNAREPKNPMTPEGAKNNGSILLNIAREQFIKDGYIIEKKAFHDAVEKISPEVMKGVSEHIALSSFIADIGKRYPEVSFAKLTRIAKAAYDFGKAEALKDLPRWDSEPKACMASEAYVVGQWLYYREHRIRVSSLEKLPGFKEDEGD